MLISAKYLRPVENAILSASFNAWQSLGNQSPEDISGADAEAELCIEATRGPFSLDRVESFAKLSASSCSGLLSEMSGYCELMRGLSSRTCAVPHTAIEKLFPPCAAGSMRPIKILAAVGCMVGDAPGEVPGLDRESATLAAVEFFLEVPDLPRAARLLAEGRWGLPKSYSLASAILSESSHMGAARAAWEMGRGMGDPVCASHLAALEFLDGHRDPGRFRTIQHAAERGFPVPLAVASWALETGMGVDRDSDLASAYRSISRKSPPPGWLVARMGDASGEDWMAARTTRSTQVSATAILFDWARKHPQDPVHFVAAREWHRQRAART